MKHRMALLCLLVAVVSSPVRSLAQATVNESLETAFLYVDANTGSDSNPGTQSQPLKTIGAAAGLAVTNNQNSIGTKITINPGTYREAINLSYSSRDTSLPITFEAATTGTAIVSGGVLYTGWTKYSANPSIYTHSWTNDWSVCAQISGCPDSQDIVLHQEMVAVNGAVLTQVLGFSSMQPGTFYADNAGNTLYVWPAAGTSMSSATVEVGTVPTLLNLWKKSNIVIRGLVFQYANSCRGVAAVEISGDADNVLLDSDTFQWNNGQGLSVSNPLSNFSVINSVAVHNGDSGFQAYQTKNGLWQSDVASYNNWRGAQGAYYACNVSGAHYYGVHNDTINGFTIAYNQAYGVHWDTDDANISTSGMIVTNNVLPGVFSENNQGPLTIDSSYICNNNSPITTAGLAARNSQQITLSHSTVLNNALTQLSFFGESGGMSFADWDTGNTVHVQIQNFTSTNNIIQGNDSTQNLFQDNNLGGSDWTTFQSTLNSSQNTWWNANDTTSAFIVPSPKSGTLLDFAGWQSTTGQDASSSFAAPSGNPAASCTLTPDTPDYRIVVDNENVTANAAGQAIFNVTFESLNFQGTINLALDGVSQVSGLSATLSPNSIVNSGTSVLTVTAAPGTKAGTYPVTVLATSGNTTHTVTVEVTVPTTSIWLSAASLTFASQQVGTISTAQTITMQNTGTKSLSITSIVSSSTSFTQTNNCGLSLAAGKTCTLTVTFTPTYVGTPTGTITVTDGDATSPQKITLSGTSTAAPTITLSPRSLFFGSVTVGTTSASQTITVTNSSASVILTFNGIKLTGTNKTDYKQTNTCGLTLSAGASCSITVTFTPSAKGTRTASVSITDNTRTGTDTVNLTGTGK